MNIANNHGNNMPVIEKKAFPAIPTPWSIMTFQDLRFTSVSTGRLPKRLPPFFQSLPQQSLSPTVQYVRILGWPRLRGLAFWVVHHWPSSKPSSLPVAFHITFLPSVQHISLPGWPWLKVLAFWAVYVLEGNDWPRVGYSREGLFFLWKGWLLPQLLAAFTINTVLYI